MTPSSLPILLEPQQLPDNLDSAAYRLVDLSKTEQYATGHIPGAVHLPPGSITSSPPIPGLMPSEESLRQVFASLGHHADLHYIVYDDEGGGWAGRFIWILDSIGHSRYSYLNGGLKAWLAEERELETQPNTAEPTQPALVLNADFTVELDNLANALNGPDTVIWDARSPEEYRGEKVLATRGGHIPGAINLEWTAAMDPQRGSRIREDLLDILKQLGITPDKEVITHCQTHHRSGFTYLAARILGFPRIKAYAGSWSEWGNRPDTPTEI
ncbi:MAG TPA: sulfurtransferase [Pseudomonas xinjiangensis]|uniref:Sulfurtransferase n=2 Tax=root TaxID=1 RepID=A0A7V1FSJ7_9GAMM|nr:sulfurtransferase [Halopseudomonas xinjiangensis]HEC49470.1 sulfurtransferase [Halopseudomonas xinjiangensis]